MMTVNVHIVAPDLFKALPGDEITHNNTTWKVLKGDGWCITFFRAPDPDPE